MNKEDYKEDYINALLKRSLGSSEKPDSKLVSKVKYLNIWEESVLKKTTIRRSVGSIAAIVIACLLITTSVFAAWYFLSPSQVAEEFNHPLLAKAFESDEALIINETQSDGGYDITLLGVVSGSGLTEFDSSVDISQTYAVVAIAKQGGTMPAPMDDDYDSTPFFVSPLIHGQIPWQYNMASMGGGTSSFVTDGIMYRLVQCDNVEIFADRGLTLIVSSTTFYSIEAFDYNESTGLVTPNPDFDGVNIMFDLPLDASKSDYEKAQEYLDTLWDQDEETETDPVPRSLSDADRVYIIAEGSVSEEVMTYESMTVWIEEHLAEAQAMVESGGISTEVLELYRQDYERYLKDIEDGKKVTIYTMENGEHSFSVSEPTGGPEITVIEF